MKNYRALALVLAGVVGTGAAAQPSPPRDLIELRTMLDGRQTPIVMKAGAPVIPGVFSTVTVEATGNCSARMTTRVPAFSHPSGSNPKPIERVDDIAWSKIQWADVRGSRVYIGPGEPYVGSPVLTMDTVERAAELKAVVDRVVTRCSGEAPMTSKEFVAATAPPPEPPKPVAEVYPAGLSFAYTRWHMTPAEVAAASRGAVRVTGEPGSSSDRQTLASGPIAFLGHRFEADYVFSYGHLIQVRLDGRGADACDAVRRFYGQSKGQFFWVDVAERNYKVNFFPRETACSIYFEALRI